MPEYQNESVQNAVSGAEVEGTTPTFSPGQD